MKLVIDPGGGMSGDMFSAALISAGAPFDLIRETMEKSASFLGEAEIQHVRTDDGSIQLKIDLASKHSHLSGTRGHEIIETVCSEAGMTDLYTRLGHRILDILLKAEQKAHSEHKFLTDHHHHHGEETLLHEAQDIVVDIMGAVAGLQYLQVRPKGFLLDRVAVGDGTITFSHGTLDVPAPATEIILEEHKIPWKKGPVKHELCTPTGAAILAALESRLLSPNDTHPHQSVQHAQARGSKILPIPPLKIYIF